MFTLPDHLWPPQRRGLAETIRLIEQGVDVCLYAPTGGGKTEVAKQLAGYALSRRQRLAFGVNRRLLIPQTVDKFRGDRLPVAIRAAGYDDEYDDSAPIQVFSADTERSRVYERKIWQPLDVDILVVDEAHLQRTGTMRQLIDDHKANGGRVVLLTATPIGLSDWADQVVISGTLQEYRDCKALVPAVVRSIEQPDLRKVKRNKTGEFVIDGKKRMIYTQTIIGHVIERWKKYADGGITFAYWPGVAESVWGTEQFMQAGIPWAHIDATNAIVDGQRTNLTRGLWAEIQERLLDRSIMGVSSRFKLREGVDIPEMSCCILATPIGSLASYIQTVGRVLRYSSVTPDKVLVIDHGGNYLRHGSPNHDRAWSDWWTMPENAISSMHMDRIRNREAPEPIRCPKCEGERVGGFKCPHCGFEHKKSQREVVMADGRMVTRDGDVVQRKVIRKKPDTEALWKKLVLSCHRYKKKRTFKQLEAYFFYTHHYYPPRDIPLMPRREDDFSRRVDTIPMNQLR